jgi:hypothetical protein
LLAENVRVVAFVTVSGTSGVEVSARVRYRAANSEAERASTPEESSKIRKLTAGGDDFIAECHCRVCLVQE